MYLTSPCGAGSTSVPASAPWSRSKGLYSGPSGWRVRYWNWKKGIAMGGKEERKEGQREGGVHSKKRNVVTSGLLFYLQE